MIFSQPGFSPAWEQNGGPGNRIFSFTLRKRKPLKINLLSKLVAASPFGKL